MCADYTSDKIQRPTECAKIGHKVVRCFLTAAPWLASSLVTTTWCQCCNGSLWSERIWNYQSIVL